MKSLIVLICFLVLSMATNDQEWESFKTKFNRKYQNHIEELFRKKIFLDNKMIIDQHNRLFDEGKTTFTMGINQFSDMTTQEFNEQMMGYVMAPEDPSTPVHVNTGATPSAFDWRTKNCVTRVKDQSRCGSCWAFSATGAVESVQCVKAGKLVEVSEQELIDCSRPEGNNGCLGGWMNNAFQYIISHHGIESESSYPYHATDNTCQHHAVPKAANIRSYANTAKGNEDDLRNAVYKQPVSVAIDASHLSFQNYKQGVYYESSCSSTQVTHAVLVVGFGTESGSDYWIAKNSWSTNWGDKGYIKMSRNRQNNCAIATYASYPIF